jgi:predicted amino acid-binding ACT domain protein
MTAPKFTVTGLVLVSATNEPGVEEKVLAVLEPFTIEINEIQRIALRGRLIIGILIGFDPVHAPAIEADINAFSENSGIDAAFDYSSEAI